MSNEHDPGKMQSIRDVLSTLVGKTVTISNAEALCGAPTGYRIAHAVYPAKVRGLSGDLLTLIAQFDPVGRGTDNEPAREFIPIAYVKRVSVTKGEIHIHL